MRLRLAGGVIAAASLITATLVTTSVTATAAPTSLYAPSALVLTMSYPGGTTDTAARAVTLSCAPRADGTHPDAIDACAELRSVHGQLDALVPPASDQACTNPSSPVTITVDGVWQGTHTSWKHAFANSCEMNNVATQSSLFNF
ncbi:SSI family serine proteinase inhibitor [Streptomyces sp. NPDC047028]|uniref:SSI family serine proteinase inhibitor n=1 Tax=Streptomyces sp. NPDC047028 TaxID=3155793 RepID=UPI0033C5EFAF